MPGDDDHLPGGADVAIRPADLDDIAALAALAAGFRSDATGAQRVSYLNPIRSPTYFRQVLGEHTILVAVADARLVAYAHFGPVTVTEAHADSADRLLHRLSVEVSLQGRGIGRRLMLAALSRPELAGAPCIFLRVSEQNARAVALYSDLGFQRAQARHFTTGAAPPGSLVMVLDRREQRR